jgi:hypothetical protein
MRLLKGFKLIYDNMSDKNTTIHKFIDEAGDPNYFGKGGINIIGTDGVSNTFSLGMVTITKGSIKNPNEVNVIRRKIDLLASRIQSSAFYKDIPSVQKRIQKYGKFVFHAKDDLPEIRKEFLDLLLDIRFSFQCVVARKIPSLFVNKHNKNENELYADLLSHLLKDKVHKKLVLNIAQLGKSTNEVNLEKAVKKATTKFMQKNKIENLECNIVYNVQSYANEPILSIADYCLWTVQRVFEKGEDRFYNYLIEKDFQIFDIYDFSAYNQIDQLGKKKWSNYYNKKNPLTKGNKVSPSSS